MNDNLTKDVQQIRERNKRVEFDKAWEVSWTRRLFIVAMTFIFASVWLLVIRETNVLLKAMVPTMGYLLSTLSIPQIKSVWIRKRQATGEKQASENKPSHHSSSQTQF